MVIMRSLLLRFFAIYPVAIVIPNLIILILLLAVQDLRLATPGAPPRFPKASKPKPQSQPFSFQAVYGVEGFGLRVYRLSGLEFRLCV